MSDITHVAPLGFPWPTRDPFLFCAHHDDAYPAGNDQFGPPAESLAGREIGMDFTVRDGWRMYHGEHVPGFPQHPHRGFETVTVVRRGLLDHADSMGAAARYGGGDVQWLTAGSGILHSEVFPLLANDRDNPLELFQIWLNLPRANKLVEPHFSMMWNEAIPRHHGEGVDVAVIAGRLGDAQALPPPPSSWAARDDSHVAIWTIKLQPGAQWTLPAGPGGVNRTLYFFAGSQLRVGGDDIPAYHLAEVNPEAALSLEAGDDAVELLLLQGRPIGEPVAHHGPFVMNTRNELVQAFEDFRRTQFGGWPWPSQEPVHGPEQKRFARFADGSVDEPA